MSLNSSTYNRILSKGLEANLPGIEDGKLRFTIDTGRLFLDSGENRVEISDFVKGKTAQEIIQTEHPLPKFYLASDTDILYYFNNNTDQWNTVKVDIGLATTASEGLMPALEDDTSKFLRSDGTWAEAGNAKYEELEREDYEALTDDEKKNSTLYLVKDKREDPDLPALIGEYYKIDNSRLNPNVSTDYIRWCFNRSDAEYIYEKYNIYDWNFHPPYDGPGWGSNSNFLITDNMPVDTCYIMTLFAIYGLSGRMLVFIPKEIIDNGIGCMTRNGFYSTQDFEYYTIEFWGDWSDPASYGTIETHTFECAGGIHHIHPGQHFETTRMSFCNIPYLVGYDFSNIKPGRDLQESLDRYLADRSYSEFPEFYDGNYFMYNGIMREYDGTLMVNDIDYTDRIDISKYALKSELSGYASTADLAGKQDVLTAGSNITFNGSTISANNTTYDLATTSSIGLMPALNGSTAKYLRSDGTWEIPAGGGGGSSVSITPALTTGTKIADYSINGSTGELYAPNNGGGGTGSSVTTLYTGTQREQTISLSDSLNNYDAVIVSCESNSNNTTYRKDVIYNTKTLSIGDNIGCTDDISYLWYDIVNMTSLSFYSEGGSAYYIKNIVGLKFGSGEGSNYSETVLWSGEDSDTMILSESFEDYDEILFIGEATESEIHYVVTNTWSVEDLKAYINEGSRLCAVANDAWYEYITISNDTTFTRQNRNILYISEIRGVKYGGGSGGSRTIYKASDYNGAPSLQDVPYDNGITLDSNEVLVVTYTDPIDASLFGTIVVPPSLLNTPVYYTGYSTRVNLSYFGLTSFYQQRVEAPGESAGYAPRVYQIDALKIGGDSNVEANPQDTPTDTLKTIRIGDTVYDIAGKGGAGRTIVDTLWSGSETPTAGAPYTATLSNAITEYDLIVIDAYESNEGCQMQLSLPVSTIVYGEKYSDYYYNTANYVEVTDATHINFIMFASANLTVYTKITGLKFTGTLAPLIYSEEEREVGVWIDNKPLYQKTYVKNNIVLTDNNWANGILGTSGIYITDFKAYFGLENTSNSNFPYSYYRNNSEFFTSIIDASHEDINVRPNMNAGVNVTAGTITIWYTKNSDVPGSGSYNTFGELMHHYSTEEKVVGIWVDGNTLYEKSYTNFSSLTGQSRTLDFQLSGIDKIWYVSDGCLISNGTYPFPYIHYDPVNIVGGFWDLSIAGSPKFEFRTGSQSIGAVINVFTIRYTKTTS